MSSGTVQFHYAEGCRFKLPASRKHSLWLKEIAIRENTSIRELNIIFCSDEYLLNINKEYLDHDYYTDIITFDLSDQPGGPIEGELYISIDRTADNAISQKTETLLETQRVMAHGLLHLCGYRDKTEDEIRLMRKKEDLCLELLESMFHVEQSVSKGK
jgi:probable rRNA maturation factor